MEQERLLPGYTVVLLAPFALYPVDLRQHRCFTYFYLAKPSAGSDPGRPTMLIFNTFVAPPLPGTNTPEKFTNHGPKWKLNFKVLRAEFPSFLPKDVENVKDSSARKLASRIERLPVQLSLSKSCIMSSCVKPKTQLNTTPLVLLHGFDSSCLEWRYTLPLLEDAGFETWAVDILGWGFSNLEKLPSCNVDSKRDHLYQFWKSHIKRPIALVGPSLGAAVAIDFAVKYPQAVDKLILIDANVYAEGTGSLASLPKLVAYAGVYLLRSLPLRLYATSLAFNNISWDTCFDWMKIGRLHCLLPWWDDATVDFMISGGYNVSAQITQVKQKTLVIWGENDQIIDNKLAVRLHCELPNAIIRQIPDCGHIPHVEKPTAVTKLIAEFIQPESKVETEELVLKQ